jgi:hypothetical protein
MSAKLTFKEFLDTARKIHGNNYEYFESTFINSHEKTKIKCPIHGFFFQTPKKHIRAKNRCPRCVVEKTGKKKRLLKEDFIKRSNIIHKNRYNYSLCNYVNNRTKVKIICKKHGLFEQKPDAHLTGQGCRECSILSIPQTHIEKSKKTIIDRFKKTHGNRYNYSLVDYKGVRVKIKIICKKHGVFEQVPENHLFGAGCPRCKQSRGENKIEKILNDKNLIFIRQKKFPGCIDKRSLSFDFYIPIFNTCIEYDGVYHYREGFKEGILKINQNHDKIKNEYCKNNNINLIRIPYTVKDVETFIFNKINEHI